MHSFKEMQLDKRSEPATKPMVTGFREEPAHVALHSMSIETAGLGRRGRRRSPENELDPGICPAKPADPVLQIQKVRNTLIVFGLRFMQILFAVTVAVELPKMASSRRVSSSRVSVIGIANSRAALELL